MDKRIRWLLSRTNPPTRSTRFGNDLMLLMEAIDEAFETKSYIGH